ncbi:MAG: hypothetical protein ACYCWW_15650 [Deltaproteobacteria bacterium]
MTEAAEAKAEHVHLERVLDELLEMDGGPLTAEEDVWARDQLRER